ARSQDAGNAAADAAADATTSDDAAGSVTCRDCGSATPEGAARPDLPDFPALAFVQVTPCLLAYIDHLVYSFSGHGRKICNPNNGLRPILTTDKIIIHFQHG